jgi:hypothetical protein
MASKHMKRGRQYLRALARHEKETKNASEQLKPQPESFDTVEVIDSTIKEMSSADVGIALNKARKRHLKKDGTRTLLSFRKADDFKRLQQLESEWKKRLHTF